LISHSLIPILPAEWWTVRGRGSCSPRSPSCTRRSPSGSGHRFPSRWARCSSISLRRAINPRGTARRELSSAASQEWYAWAPRSACEALHALFLY
jgi:hypothetical protein